MNANKFNGKFVEALKNKIEKNENLVNVLSEVLSLGKEAIYRRLRGDVVFTFTEVALLAKHLNISIDRVVGSSVVNNLSFDLHSISFFNPVERDYQTLEKLLSYITLVSGDPNAKLIYSSNMFTVFTFEDFKYLSKLYTFKRMSQFVGQGKLIPFKDLKEPERLQLLKRKIIDAFRNISDICYILDSTIFQSIVNDIKYLHNAHFITSEDVEALKEELSAFLSSFEYFTSIGMSSVMKDRRMSVYVSETSFQSTYCYVSGAGHSAGIVTAFGPTFLMSSREAALEWMTTWIQSVKKVSTLISESGEIQRRIFFDKQREIIATL